MTTDDAPRPARRVLLAECRNARLLYEPGGRRYLWEVFDDAGILVTRRAVEVREAAVLHALLPTKVRDMP